MWIPFDTFGDVKGRIRGVSPPSAGGQVLVWTDAGLFSIWFSRSAFVNKLADEAASLFDQTTGTITWNGIPYLMLGGCAPKNDLRPFTRHPGGDRVALDPEADVAQILDAAGAVQQTIEGVGSASEPWAVVAFSTDGKALVVADPNNVRVFRYQATAGRERPRWAAVASTSDQKQLFRAILANPDEDTPRLMYADWLDEHDDPARAEFIRVQCRIAERQRREIVPPDDPDRKREFDLQRQLGARWLAEMPTIRGVNWSGFWRGFPAVSVVSATTLVRSAQKIWSAAPVEWAIITGLNATGARTLAASEVLSRLRVLTIDRYYTRREGERPLQTLFNSQRLRTLLRLNLASGIGEAGVITVAASQHLTGLEWLWVSGGEMTDAAADAVIASAALRNLRGGAFVSYQMSAAAGRRLKSRFPGAVV